MKIVSDDKNEPLPYHQLTVDEEAEERMRDNIERMLEDGVSRTKIRVSAFLIRVFLAIGLAGIAVLLTWFARVIGAFGPIRQFYLHVLRIILLGSIAACAVSACCILVGRIDWLRPNRKR